MERNTLAHGIASQILAGLTMLKDCVDQCPDKDWNERHGDYPFSQVVFHTLFDRDYHLCDHHDELKEQAFHKRNRETFGDYEELEDRPPRLLYERDFINRYYEHCTGKAVSTMKLKTDSDLLIPNGDVRKNMTRLERYVNLIRHTQHHTAQLGLRLQFITAKKMDWVSRGYE